MFNYTITAFKMTVESLKKTAKIIKIIGSVFSLLYFTFAIITKLGNMITNIILLSLFVAYSIFNFVTYKQDSLVKVRKRIKKSYSWVRIAVKAFTLGATIYGIYEAKDVQGITIILAILLIIVWVFQLIFEIMVDIMEPKIKLLTAAVLKDSEKFLPLINTANFFKGNVKQEINLEGYEKELEILEPRVQENKQEKKRERFFRFNKKGE